MIIGIDESAGYVYEGGSAAQSPVWPRPVLSQAKLIATQADWDNLPKGLAGTPFEWIFREDSFDSVTRVRRGRLYERASDSQPNEQIVYAHPFDHDGIKKIRDNGRLTRRLFTYRLCQALLNRPRRGEGMTLALGDLKAASSWKILQTESIVGDDVMVTLKAQVAYGILPELEVQGMREADRKSLVDSLERVLNSAFRETPISVVDHCRNAATVILSRWLVSQGADPKVLSKDLGDVVKRLDDLPSSKEIVKNAADVIRRLHPRGKANEQLSRGLRVPTEEDAEFAIQAVGLILREVGWAK